ncbi:MAG: Gfo/Idh/MocA family oxidoreductase [Gemmataceae bacterium]|nr:Gfo/Idh/MocA family oxidoreductase [Planctomycetia bacterium]MBX3400265.1 Gfo/Idh/MocA family oxidoreductase [Gemmataceae bacterium]
MVSRRRFLGTAMASTIFTPMTWAATDAVRIAMIGPANRGAANLQGVENENIVAICDVDPANAAKARNQFPKAEFFTDYRKMYDKLSNAIDAVVISTPDHVHAHPTLTALKLGKHVYCEKPLCHSVAEVRAVREALKGTKLVTQMGTQIHAGDNYRRVVEIVKSGLLGTVNRVHVWNGSRPVAGKRVGAKPSAQFDTDLWLGPAPVEYFEATIAKSGWNFAWPHFHWRWWWEFGGGTLADLGCHYMDLPFWALDLTAPKSVIATGKKTYEGDNDTPDIMQVDYQFPGVHLTWYHGVNGPSLDGSEKYDGFGSAVLFVGDKGKLVADYGKYKLLPDAFAAGVTIPTPSIAKSIGHHAEWLNAIRNGGPTTCNFEYSGRLTEAVLLGNVAYRSGEAIEWDAKTAAVTNTAKAKAFLGREYRKGWSI